MDKLIEVDFKVTWQAPVFVRIDNGFRERVDGPDAALEALAHRWPECHSEAYREAKLRCLAALSQRGSAELARSRFVEAAVTARVFA